MTNIFRMPDQKGMANDQQQKELAIAAKMLQSGGLVAFPTETVYGLGADATNPAAVERIFTAKGRPSDNPLIVHLATISQIEKWVEEIPPIAFTLMHHFSPGPITYVLKHRGGLASNVTAGLDTVGIRIPNHPIALALLARADVPVAAPSANVSGKPSPTNASHVMEDLAGKVNIIIDGGPTQVGVESTVIDVTGEIPILLRPGGITLEAIQAVVGEVLVERELTHQPRSPGMKYRHYAPNGEMWLVSGEDMVEKIKQMAQEKQAAGYRVGVLTTTENKEKYPSIQTVVCGSKENPSTIAQHLYDALRTFDTLGIELIFAETFPLEGLYFSVMNRLKKAAEGKIIE